MVVGWYHGLNMSPGLRQALLVLHWDACVFILSNIELSHMLAGHFWASEPEQGVLQFVSVYMCCSYNFIFVSPRFWPATSGIWFGGASQRTGMHLYVIDRSEQWGNGRKGDDEAGTATHYIIQAKLCLSSYRAVNIIFFATMNTFCILCSIRSFDRVVNLC